jgi:hypothetical protein
MALMLVVAMPTAAHPGEDQKHGQHEEHAEHGEHAEQAEAAEHHEAAGHHHKHELALFLGATDEPGHDPEFSLGFEYEYRFAPRWGIGGLFDYAGGELRNTVLGIPVYWHPGGGWKLIAAPGLEHHNGRNGESGAHAKSDAHGEADKDETYFLIRLGVAYDIHIGSRYGLAPAINLDLVNNEEVWVYGLNFAVKF